jgi:hypothetical protein
MTVSQLEIQKPRSPQLDRRRSALSYLRGVVVCVDDQSTSTDHAMTAADVKTFVEIMLRIARIPLFSPEAKPEGAARLHITLNTRKVADLYSVQLIVEIIERVFLVRPSSGEAIEAATWRESSAFVANRHDLRESLRQELGKLLAVFMNDFVAAKRD